MRKNEGRTVGLYTKVSPEEKEVIDQKMVLPAGWMVYHPGAQVCWNRPVREDHRHPGRAVQRRRHCHAQDVEDLRQGYAEVWQEISDLLKKFETL